MEDDNHSCLSKWPTNNNPNGLGSNNWAGLPSIVLHEIFSLLSHNERLWASSVCHHWRQALYHPNFWPTVQFSLHPEFDNDKSYYLIKACSHLVRQTSIDFMPLSTWCIEELIELLRRLSNNYNLRTLMLEPSHCHIPEQSSSQSFMRQTIFEYLISICPRLEEFSLGCNEELCTNVPIFLEAMAKAKHPEYVRVLGLASVKQFPSNYLIVDVEPQLFTNFSNLRMLSVDYDYVSDIFLENLRGAKHLDRLVVHVHGWWDSHPGVSENAWSNFVAYHPQCGVRLTLIHAYEAIQQLHKIILHQSLPLTHLKVLFCGELNYSVLNLLSSWYRMTLRSIVWVDTRTNTTMDSLLRFFDLHIPDPLVMAAWTCTKLEEIVLLGYKYMIDDIIAIARLRGNVLKRIVFADADILTDDDIFDKARKEISKILRFEWFPVSEEDVHPTIKCAKFGDFDNYILPLVLADLH